MQLDFTLWTKKNVTLALITILFCFSSYGWLFHGKVGYPMQVKHRSCGNKIGIIAGRHLIDKKKKYNAWCYKKVIA